ERMLPQALSGCQRPVPAFASLEQFRRRLGVSEGPGAAEQRAALDLISRQERGQPGSLLQFIERTTVISYASSAKLEQVRARDSSASYPEFLELAKRMRLIAQLIKAGLGTS